MTFKALININKLNFTVKCYLLFNNFLIFLFMFCTEDTGAYERSHKYSRWQKAVYKALFPLARRVLLTVPLTEYNALNTCKNYAFYLLNRFQLPLFCWLYERCIYLHKLCCRFAVISTEMIYQNVLLTWQWRYNRTLVLFGSMCTVFFTPAQCSLL